MRRTTHLLVILYAAVVLGLPLVLTLVGVRPSVEENRELTSFPSMSPASIVDDTTYAQAVDFYTDRLALRDTAIDLNQRIDSVVSFGQNTEASTDIVLVGQDGWYFYQRTLTASCPDVPPSDFLNRGDRSLLIAEEAGVELLFAVAPDKVAIYPEHLPTGQGLAGLLNLSADPVDRCSDRWTDALTAAALHHPWLMPLVQPIRDAKAVDDRLLYYPTDTHWTDTGSLVMLKSLLDRFGPELWDPENHVFVEEGHQGHDLLVLLGREQLPETPRPTIIVQRPGIVTTIGPSLLDGSPGVPWVQRSSTTTDGSSAIIEGTTLMLVDSFGEATHRLLAPYFETLVTVTYSVYLSQSGQVDVSQLLEAQPDRIIIESVTRVFHEDPSRRDLLFDAAELAISAPY